MCIFHFARKHSKYSTLALIMYEFVCLCFMPVVEWEISYHQNEFNVFVCDGISHFVPQMNEIPSVDSRRQSVLQAYISCNLVKCYSFFWLLWFRQRRRFIGKLWSNQININENRLIISIQYY